MKIKKLIILTLITTTLFTLISGLINSEFGYTEVIKGALFGLIWFLWMFFFFKKK